MIDWANEHKSSNYYSEFEKIYSRDDRRYIDWNYSDVEPISRAEAIKMVEESYGLNMVEKRYGPSQNYIYLRVILDTLEYKRDEKKDVLMDMLEGKVGSLNDKNPEVKFIRFAFFSDEEIMHIAKGLKNFSLEELNKILQNCSSRRLRQHIEDFIQVLENREEQ